MCALLSSASSRSVTTRLTHTVCSTVAQRAQADRLAGQPDDCPSESGNLSRRSLASRLAGNRFDGGVLWQRVIKRLVDGLFTLSGLSWRTGEEVVDEYKFEKYALTCAPSRIRTCAHGSGDRGRLRRRTHSDPGKHAPGLPSGPVFSRNSLAVPAAPQSPGALPPVSAPRTGAGPSGPARSCPARPGRLPLTCTSTRLGPSESQKVRKDQR